MLPNSKVLKLGGVFSVGFVVAGQYEQPVASEHNELLSNFLTPLLTDYWNATGFTKLGKGSTPNVAETVALITPFLTAAIDPQTVATIDIVDKTVTLDDATRIVTIVQTYRTTYAAGSIVGTLREIGHEFWAISKGASVQSRTVLPVGIPVAIEDTVYIDYTVTCMLQLDPVETVVQASVMGVITPITITNRIEVLDNLTVNIALQPAVRHALSMYCYGLPPVGTVWNLVENDWDQHPSKVAVIVDKIMTTTFTLATTQANDTTKMITAAQLGDNITYAFTPHFYKDAEIAAEFKIINDYSQIVTL